MVTQKPELLSLQTAIRRAGSNAALGRLIGVSATSVWKMLNRAKQASAEYVLKIESATGVSRHDLRPDLYPREDPPAQPSAATSPSPRTAADGSDSIERVRA